MKSTLTIAKKFWLRFMEFKNLIIKIDSYIEEVFTSKRFNWEEYGKGLVNEPFPTYPSDDDWDLEDDYETKKLKLISEAESVIENLYSPFMRYLFQLIDEKNMNDVEVYKRAHLDRRIFSKIRSNKKYIPKKRTVLAIAFGMKLNISETNNLLCQAGYELTRSREEDIIISYLLENEIYDLYLINDVLNYYGFKPLGYDTSI